MLCLPPLELPFRNDSEGHFLFKWVYKEPVGLAMGALLSYPLKNYVPNGDGQPSPAMVVFYYCPDVAGMADRMSRNKRAPVSLALAAGAL